MVVFCGVNVALSIIEINTIITVNNNKLKLTFK